MLSDDPVTIGELARRIEQGFADVKEDFRELTARLDTKVSAELFELRTNTLEDRVKNLEHAREEEQHRRSNDRRWVVAAVVIPLTAVVIMAAVQVFLAARGA